MNQVMVTMCANEEFVRQYQDSTTTAFEAEIMRRLVDEIDGNSSGFADLEAERDGFAQEADEAEAEIERKEEELAKYEEYVDAPLEFVREKDPENELLDKDKWL
jgi:Skp family chaperone for outer membrane proteins